MAGVDQTSQTPTFAKVLRDAIDARLAEVHTCLPAEIVKFDKATNLADVSPCLKRKYAADEAVVDLPVIPSVPVVQPRGGGAAILFDLKPGDPVLLVFSERSIDGWKTTGGKVDPKDPRKHHLSDAFAIPGGYPKSKPAAASLVTVEFTVSGVKIKNKIGCFEFKDNADIAFNTGTVQGLFGSGGKVKFQNVLGELIAAVSTFFAAVQAGTVAGLPIVLPPTAVQAKAVIDSFKG